MTTRLPPGGGSASTDRPAAGPLAPPKDEDAEPTTARERTDARPDAGRKVRIDRWG